MIGGNKFATLRQRNLMTHPKDVLSKREYKVALLVARGMMTKQIAEKLSLSPRTIGGMRYQIFQKLNVDSSIMMINKMLALNLMTYVDGKFKYSKSDHVDPENILP